MFNPADKTLTFQKGGVVPEGATVYALNEGENEPEWAGFYSGIKVKKVIFDPSFADVRPTSCYEWFNDLRILENIQGLEYLNTEEVTTMQSMFVRCYKLTSLDVSHFNTSKVTDMRAMFQSCSGLTSLDVSRFDTSEVTNMADMFNGCSNLKSLDVPGLDTSKVTDMANMFRGCSNLNSLDLSSFDTSKVTDMFGMFLGCRSLTSLNVSGFKTSEVTDMSSMFAYTLLKTIDLSHFDTSKVEDMSDMFQNSQALTELDLSSFDTSLAINKEDGLYEMFSMCKNLETIYASDKFVVPNTPVEMFYGNDKLVGVVPFEDAKLNSDMANSKTGYFKGGYKKYGTHKPEKVEIYADVAHYQRAHSNEWATVCLPFTFTTQDNATYRFYALKSIENAHLSATPLSGTIEAGTPVLVRDANTAENNNMIKIDGVDEVLIDEAKTQTTATANFVGTFEDVTNLPDDNFIILKDNFWLASDLKANRPGSTVNINALRAYITPAAGALRANKLTISVDDENGVTGIGGVEAAENDSTTEMYDLQGRRLNSLQRGLNIVRVGGKTKKVMVN